MYAYVYCDVGTNTERVVSQTSEASTQTELPTVSCVDASAMTLLYCVKGCCFRHGADIGALESFRYSSTLQNTQILDTKPYVQRLNTTKYSEHNYRYIYFKTKSAFFFPVILFLFYVATL